MIGRLSCVWFANIIYSFMRAHVCVCVCVQSGSGGISHTAEHSVS